MKIIKTSGVSSIEELKGSGGWYCGSETGDMDLYEAESHYKSGNQSISNRFILLHHPDGRVLEPVRKKAGRFFGSAVFSGGKIYFLAVDFGEAAILIYQFDTREESVDIFAELPLSSVEDCYNLSLGTEPIMLVQSEVDRFKILWPEKKDYTIGLREYFDFREGDRLYFYRWNEKIGGDPEYWDDEVVRRFQDGEILEVLKGTMYHCSDGQHWLVV